MDEEVCTLLEVLNIFDLDLKIEDHFKQFIVDTFWKKGKLSTQKDKYTIQYNKNSLVIQPNDVKETLIFKFDNKVYEVYGSDGSITIYD